MTNVHMIVGSIVVLLVLVDFVMYLLNFVRGKAIPYHKIVAFGASGFLLLQYVIGFSLLGEGKRITPFHVVVALVAIIPVGAEHMLTGQETGIRSRGMKGMGATIVTAVLVLIAYAIGEASN
ncbi:MAG TPA: hypothetical protein VNZ55_00675 [Thermomicrobiales bacterium]|nr:hypothetical protein [Thermomicrobiales bacterium]